MLQKKMHITDLKISPFKVIADDPTQFDPILEIIIVVVNSNNTPVDYFNLNNLEIEIAKRYYHTKDQKSYSIRHHLLNTWLCHFSHKDLDQLQFQITNAGKSSLVDLPFHFNISKSNEYLAFAFGPVELGIDIETIRDSTSFKPVADQHFHPLEKAFLKEDSSPINFFSIWTRKEALLKANGKGINDDLKIINSITEKQVYNSKEYLLSTYASDEYLVSLAYENEKQLPIKICSYNIR